jgi:hypothetical protein
MRNIRVLIVNTTRPIRQFRWILSIHDYFQWAKSLILQKQNKWMCDRDGSIVENQVKEKETEMANRFVRNRTVQTRGN